MFSVIVPVYNAPEATELTLRTLLAISRFRIIVVDSSTDGKTSDFLKSLDSITYLPFDRKNRECTHAHADAVAYAVPHVTTPFFMLADSDVEFYSRHIFQKASHEFAKSAAMFFVGHMKPRTEYETHIEASGLDKTGVWFYRTKMILQFFKENITFAPRFEKENDRTIRYDFGAYMLREALNRGYMYSENLDRSMFLHFGAMSRHHESVAKLQSTASPMAEILDRRVNHSLHLVQERLKLKPWEKL